jgi:A/G-specific adenine glycosylase
MVVNEYNGHFPTTYEELQKLKGIGKYTAAAIASFAFKKAVPVVDGNVFRVLARFLLIREDIADAKNFKTFFEASEALMPAKNSDLYNQAMMELGATICTPSKPSCLLCPVEMGCHAKAESKQAEFPVKLKKVKVRKRYFYYLVLQHEDQLMLKQRGAKDIWEGLYDFPMIESDLPMDEATLMQATQTLLDISQPKVNYELSEPVKHILTHQRISAQFLFLKLSSLLQLEEKNAAFYNMDEIEQLPKPVLINNYLIGKFY